MESLTEDPTFTPQSVLHLSLTCCYSRIPEGEEAEEEEEQGGAWPRGTIPYLRDGWLHEQAPSAEATT